MFRTPFLEGTELKLYGAVSGYSSQQFKYPDEHPKFKLLSDAAMGLALLIGFVEAIVSLTGKQTVKQAGASFTKQVFGDVTGLLTMGSGNISTTGNWVPNQTLTVQNQVGNPLFPNNPITSNSFFNRLNNYFSGNFITSVVGFPNTASLSDIFNEFNYNVGFDNGGTFTAPEVDVEISAASLLESGSNNPLIQTASNVLGALNKFFFYFSEGADATLELI